MMGSSGESNAVFSLLAALSDPEAAKANLKEIVAATEIYQKMVDDFRIESDSTKSDLEAQKTDIESKLAESIKIKTTADNDYAIRSKQLSDWEAVLATRQVNIVNNEQRQTTLDALLSKRESDVTAREADVSIREDAAHKLDASASAIKNQYEASYNALKSAMNVNYTMTADTGTLGGVFNGSL